jgi:DNA-binding Lrp family transcriptional regulator
LKRKLFDGETTFGFFMAIGFALLSISPLHEKTVYEILGRIPEIIELHPLFGEFDILVKIECNDIDSIGEVVINKIRSTKGVMDTKTLIGTKSLSG